MKTKLRSLSISRIKDYRTCPRLEQLVHVEGWRPTNDPEPKAMGKVFHAGLEGWWTAHMEGAYDEALDRALAMIDQHVREHAVADEFMVARAEAMMRGYHTRWQDETREKYKVLAVECRFEMPVLNPRTFAASKNWKMPGYIDAVVLELATNLEKVVEHKSSGEDIAPEGNYWAKLCMEPQLSTYTLGGESLGHHIAGHVYDVAKKPAQRPLKATPEDQRKYTKPTKAEPVSRLYSNQRETDETIDEYKARVLDAVMGDLDGYFRRRDIERTESQIKEFLEDTWAQAHIIRATHLEGFSPRNPDACFDYGVCPFHLCCSTGTTPADHPALYSQRPRRDAVPTDNAPAVAVA